MPSMVRIREMGMDVHHRLMPMPVGVSGARRNGRVMRVLVVLVMDMLMAVFHRFVSMLMLMPFGEVQPDTQRHQHTGN